MGNTINGALALELEDECGEVRLICTQLKPLPTDRLKNARSLTHATRGASGKFSLGTSLVDVKEATREALVEPVQCVGFRVLAVWRPKAAAQLPLPELASAPVEPAAPAPAPAPAPAAEAPKTARK